MTNISSPEQFETTPGKLLYTGKIIDVRRDIGGGYTLGQCVIAPLAKDEQEADTADGIEASPIEGNIVIPFQNEFLYVSHADADNNPDTKREPICTVPDLISVLGQDGEAIGSQELRYGLRVNVIAFAAHPLWTDDERGLRVGGPEGFGLKMEWKRSILGSYHKPRSVIEEFGRD